LAQAFELTMLSPCWAMPYQFHGVFRGLGVAVAT